MMRTRGDFVRLAPPQADVERWCNRTFLRHAQCIAGPQEFLSADMRTLDHRRFRIGLWQCPIVTRPPWPQSWLLQFFDLRTDATTFAFPRVASLVSVHEPPRAASRRAARTRRRRSDVCPQKTLLRDREAGATGLIWSRWKFSSLICGNLDGNLKTTTRTRSPPCLVILPII